MIPTGSRGSTGPEIRIASYDDRAAIERLRRGWTEEIAGAPVADDGYTERFEEWLGHEMHQRVTWLGWAPDPAQDPTPDRPAEPVAMLNMLVFTRMPRPGQETASRWGYLANFFVEKSRRNSGLGSWMIAACTSYADGHDFARIVLSPSTRSVPFYARAGFEPATSLMTRTRD